MSQNSHYVLCKNYKNNELICMNYELTKGFKFKPKNKISYNGIKVDEMIIINPSFVEKILKRKVKRKLDSYLKFLISILEDDNDDPTSLRNALNDLEKYKRTVINKYRDYLDKNYIDLLLKKINVLEKELKAKLILLIEKNVYDKNLEGEKESEHQRRGR